MNNLKYIKISSNDLVISLLIFCFILQFWGMPAYNDDINRFTHNFIRLSEQGRYFTEWYYSLIYLFKKNLPFNIYTFNLCVIAVMMFFSLRNISKSCQNIESIGMIVSLMVLQPFLIENISYHIDSIGMMSAMALALYAAALNGPSYLKDVTISTAAICVGLFSYQSSMAVYCTTVIFIVITMSLNPSVTDKGILYFIVKKIISFILSFVKFIIISKAIPPSKYILDASAPIDFNHSTIDTLVYNSLFIAKKIASYLNSLQILIITILSLLYYTCIILFTLKNNITLLRKAILLLSPIIASLFLFIPTVFFKNTVVAPRILMSFGILISILSVPSCNLFKLNTIKRALIVLFASLSIMTASAHVSSMKYMYSYADRILSSVETNAKINNPLLNEVVVKFIDFNGYPSESMINSQAFPIVRDLAKLHFGGKWLLGLYIQYHNYNMRIYDGDIKEYGEVISHAKDYEMYYSNGVYIVKFK